MAGAWPLRALRALGTATWLVARAGRGVAEDALEGDALASARFAHAIRIYMWEPLPVLIGLAVLVGLIAGTAAVRLLALYDAELAIVPPLLHLMARDVVPLLTGLFAAGRVSVDLSARLAATALVNEIDALEALGRDPVRHLLAPALAGVVAAVPIYVLAAAGAAFAAIGLALRLDAAVDWPSFVRIAAGEGAIRAIGFGMLKSLLFALIAFGVGAEVGSRGARGAGEIGRRATTAFTAGLLAIFAADTVWTLLG